MDTIAAEILETCTVTCQPGSVVEITEQQLRALGNKARYLPDDIEITLLEPGKTETEVSETVENSVESVENTPEASEIRDEKTTRGTRKKG